MEINKSQAVVGRERANDGLFRLWVTSLFLLGMASLFVSLRDGFVIAGVAVLGALIFIRPRRRKSLPGGGPIAYDISDGTHHPGEEEDQFHDEVVQDQPVTHLIWCEAGDQVTLALSMEKAEATFAGVASLHLSVRGPMTTIDEYGAYGVLSRFAAQRNGEHVVTITAVNALTAKFSLIVTRVPSRLSVSGLKIDEE